MSSGKPLSRFRTHADVVYTSGQVGIASDGSVPEDFAAQFRVAINNLRRVLEDAGASIETVLKTTVFLVDRAHTEEMNRLYVESRPSGSCPARTAWDRTTPRSNGIRRVRGGPVLRRRPGDPSRGAARASCGTCCRPLTMRLGSFCSRSWGVAREPRPRHPRSPRR
jgi:2-iminobutanoate/2-iminopropanoate deaminase